MNEATKRQLAVVLAFGALYAGLAGTVSVDELIAGAIAVGPAAAFAGLYARVGKVFGLRAPWCRLIASVLRSVVADSVRVGLRLAAQLEKRPTGSGHQGSVGMLVEQKFEYGSLSPEEAGRRALVTLAVSLAPNKYVVSLSPRDQRLILHELEHVRNSPNERWPV